MIVAKRGAGCGGRKRCLKTRALDADGEVVWFWRLDAGVKSCGAIRKATETNKPDLRGEHEGSR